MSDMPKTPIEIITELRDRNSKLERELTEARKNSERLHQIERLSEDGCLHIGTSTNEESCAYRISFKDKIHSGRDIRAAIDATLT